MSKYIPKGRPTSAARDILRAMAKKPRGFTAADAVAATGLEPKQVAQMTARMKDHGELFASVLGHRTYRYFDDLARAMSHQATQRVAGSAQKRPSTFALRKPAGGELVITPTTKLTVCPSPPYVPLTPATHRPHDRVTL